MTHVVGDAWALEVEGRTVNAFLGSPDRGTRGELPSARHPALTVTRDAASGTYTVRVPHSRDGVTLALPVEAGERVSVERRQSATGKKLKYQTRTMSLDHEKNTLVSFRGLTVGDNLIDLAVKRREDSDAWKLTFKVTRVATKSHDPSLKSINIRLADLSPAFSPEATDYETSVDFAVTELALSVGPLEAGTTIAVSGTSADGGALDVDDSLGIEGLAVGRNAVRILTTSEDGAATRMYSVEVQRREPSSDASLNALHIAIGRRKSFAFFGSDIEERNILKPPFDGAVSEYGATIPSDAEEGAFLGMAAVSDPSQSVKITARAADGTTLATQGMSVGSNEVSRTIIYVSGLQVGMNTITVTVTAQDAVTRSLYSINVLRE